MGLSRSSPDALDADAPPTGDAIAELNAEQTEAFTRDVGRVCEDYVGRQLRLIPNATITLEIVYDDDKRSVDWFVVFDELVVLVEVKSTRMSHLARMGSDKLKDDVDRCLGKAYKQVSRSDGLLADGNAAFAEIPTDRPRLAIIVTLEPYWAANSPFIAEFLPESPVPTTVASVRALERLVDILRTVGGPGPLTKVLDDPDRRTWNLENALPEIEVPKNPILDAAWNRFPFPTGDS